MEEDVGWGEDVEMFVTPCVHTGGVSSFRFPDGVEFLGEGDDGHVLFNVDTPIDEDGYYGRECPSCEQHFRVAYEDYFGLPDDLRLWCVYCGHNDDRSAFMTQQQLRRVTRVASDYATQQVLRTLDRSFGRMARRSRGSMVQVTYHSRPFNPAPLPGINEERLVRERQCGDCSLRYAVFGEHRFCPVCGLLPPLLSALDALSAERLRLDALADLEPAAVAVLRESGALQRTYVDTIENVVGIVEAMAERIFRAGVPSAEADLKAKGKVFQRLDDLADLFQARLAIDLRSNLGSDWPELLEAWAARHIFTHCDGIVDDKYLAAVPTTLLKEGQRLQITENYSRRVLTLTERLCQVLAD